MRRRKGGAGARAPWTRRRRRALLVLAGVGLVIAPALVWRLSVRAELNQRIADLRERGVPLTLEELNAWHAGAFDGEESDAVLRDIFSHYTELDLATFEHLPKFEAGSSRLLELPYAPETRRALEARVSGNEAMLGRLIGAAAIPQIRLIRELDGQLPVDGSDLVRPLEVLCAHACLQAEAGDGDGAVDSLIAGLQVARACRPTVTTGMLNRVIGYEFMLASVLPSVALRAPISRERMQALEALIAADDWQGDVTFAARGDRCIQLHLNRVDPGAWGTIFAVAGIYDRKRIHILDYYEAYAELAAMPAGERYAYLESSGMVYDYSYVRPPLSCSYEPLVVALMRHYQREGRFPDALDGLSAGLIAAAPSGDVAAAPQYVVEGAGFVLNDVRWALTLTAAAG